MQKQPDYPRRVPRPCPECGRESRHDTYPFCSSRCRTLDLNRWLSGAYVLPGPAHEVDEEE
ncbi:DNA gyrase inhibitor YacG [Bartonella ancashensis]|uniref:DNA gyrase inhibitor YacG n=1 Tax=Bartonella ancashensis TaxID=1318743 RepID=A0A0M5KSC8_9HYPH|nr:DNA gyrase inhibitor YacG [Bartonella ancashensis]ALE03078.1 non-essential pilus assembly protein [Bartonella ancashensis]